MRALLGEQKGMKAAEVLLGLHKAFELVDRGLLVAAARDAGYPCDVLAWGLATYSWRRRLVFRGCVTPELWPTRGIAAGSAFATTELWVLLCASLGRLTRRFPLARFCLHVDDLTATAEGAADEEVAEQLAQVVAEIKKEVEECCRMKLAKPKTSAVATSLQLAEKVAEAIGGAAEVGLVTRKLGADYGLSGRAAADSSAKRPSRRGWVQVGAEGQGQG